MGEGPYFIEETPSLGIRLNVSMDTHRDTN